MTETVIKAAKNYAKANNCDIIRPAIEQGGYSYFCIDFTGRPKYTGHPIVIKVNQFGKVAKVSNLNEIYLISEQAKEPLL